MSSICDGASTRQDEAGTKDQSTPLSPLQCDKESPTSNVATTVGKQQRRTRYSTVEQQLQPLQNIATTRSGASPEDSHSSGDNFFVSLTDAMHLTSSQQQISSINSIMNLSMTSLGRANAVGQRSTPPGMEAVLEGDLVAASTQDPTSPHNSSFCSSSSPRNDPRRRVGRFLQQHQQQLPVRHANQTEQEQQEAAERRHAEPETKTQYTSDAQEEDIDELISYVSKEQELQQQQE